jgi:glycosyltransferase involved in cell wall biosynthesis
LSLGRIEEIKVAFLIQGMEASSSRYRVLQYLPFLKEQGVDVSVHPRQQRWRDKLTFYNSLYQYDLLFIQRKLFTPAEFLYIRHKAKKIVYDFDDAVMYRSSGSASSISFSRRFRFGYMMKRVDYVIAGNQFLKSEVQPYNKNVAVIPTTIDLSRYSAKEAGDQSNVITIGWLGSSSTLKYLRPLIPVLERTHRKHPNVQLKIVCDQFLDAQYLPVIKKRWASEEEEADLKSFDIGIMPLTDDLWSRGKCGLKILQYYSVGVPVVCTPVGINGEIVEDGVNGFWARNETEWEERLLRLIEEEGLRREMGINGRRTVEEGYSLEVNAPRLFSVIKEVMQND